MLRAVLSSLYHPCSVRLPRKLPEFTCPKGLLLRRVNNSGDISWHKNRVFISEVFRFEELAFELITPGFYRAFFRDMEIGELNLEELRLELHGEWSEFAAECVALNASTEERAMMSSWRVTLLALGFRRSNRPARDVDQAIIEG